MEGPTDPILSQTISQTNVKLSVRWWIMPVYSVPSAVVFRSWAERRLATDEPQTRRLLLKNDGPVAVSFRLTLPASGAFQVNGSCIDRASSGGVSSASLAPNGTASFVITLLPDETNGAAELHNQLVVRTRQERLCVPVVAVRDAQSPCDGEPEEVWGAPVEREHWSDDNDSDDGNAPGPRGIRRAGGRLKRDPKVSAEGEVLLTPAECTDAEELSFYKQVWARPRGYSCAGDPGGLGEAARRREGGDTGAARRLLMRPHSALTSAPLAAAVSLPPSRCRRLAAAPLLAPSRCQPPRCRSHLLRSPVT